MARTTPGAPGDRLAAGLHADRWNRLEAGLKDLAALAVAASISCTCCVDAGYWEQVTTHEAMARKIRAIPDWQDSEVFTELERLVMLYAEAMTMTPPLVIGDLVEELRRHLDEVQLGELTAVIAVENLRLRMNAALGAAPPGFPQRPGLPAASRE
jgi:alkylhydroperoxidase family enzyme